MQISYGPMEGITGHIYRMAHKDIFGGVDTYHAPFIAPDSQGNFKVKGLKDLDPSNNRGIDLVPQLLVNKAEPFLLVTEQLKDMGYDKVELNIGCPSATVVGKHKGSGMLLDLESLERCLDRIFQDSPLPVWIKTRMGMEDVEEFGRIAELYSRYPIQRLTIHARVRADMYKAAAQPLALLPYLDSFPFPVWYNGDIFSPEDVQALAAAGEKYEGIMLARGAVADPALPRRIKGGEPLSLEELRAFHGRLIDDFQSQGSPQATAARMKELWSYMQCKFPGCKKQIKELFKAKSLGELCSCAEQLFSSGSFQALQPFPGTTKL